VANGAETHEKPGRPRTLVIGFGSIGSRHARLFAEAGTDIVVVSRRADVHPVRFASIAEALADSPADIAVISTETNRHRACVDELVQAGFTGRLLIEKPLGAPGDPPLPDVFKSVVVGYHLRFSPVLRALRRRLETLTPLTVEVRAASWLPDWRPGRDYRTTESASRAAGGGVLRDLSHEIDYVVRLFGRPTRLTARGGRLGCLDIDSDEAWAILAETARVPVVTVSLSYIARGAERRRIAVDTAEGISLRADLVAARITENDVVTFQGDPRDIDGPYRDQIAALLGATPHDGCSPGEAEVVMDVIAAVERAAETGEWVTL